MNLSGPTNVTHANPGEERISKEMASSVLASHMPGIDVLRGAAILSVVVFHGMSYSAPDMKWGNPFAQGLYSLTSWGWLGVNLFFVLSGFLISGILDDSRGGGAPTTLVFTFVERSGFFPFTSQHWLWRG